jgi:hypothetical protein
VIASCQPAEPKSRPAPHRVPDKEPEAQADNPVPFGYKCAWLAIKTDDPQAVVQELGLENVRTSGWQKGVNAAYSDEVFVTPPIKGWVLAAGRSLPQIDDKVQPDQLTLLVKSLGTKFPDVQYFRTYRVADYHGWLRATKGEIVRRWAFASGEMLSDEGKRTDEETKLGLIYNDDKFPNEEHVMQLAGAWSVDPSSLDQLKLEKSVGYLGSLPKK